MIKCSLNHENIVKNVMPKQTLMIFLLCGYLALAGCGTKGPLYIPEQRYPQQHEEMPAPQPFPTTQPTTKE